MKYKEKRAELMNRANTLINEGKIEDANAVMAEVKDLDGKHEAESKAKAELEALNGVNVGVGISALGEGVVKDVKTPNVKDKQDEYFKAWAKQIHGDALTAAEQKIIKDLNETATVGEHEGVLVPTTFKAGIWQRIEEQHPMFADARPTYVNGNVVIRKGLDDDDAAWYAEVDTVESDDINVGTLTLKGCELAKDIQISWKLKKMGIDELLAYIQSRLARKMGKALARGMAKGAGPDATEAGKDEPTGIITTLLAETDTPQVITVAANASLAYTNLTDAMSRIESGYNPVFYANNKTIWNDLANILDNNGRPIFIPDTTTGGVGRIFGVTVKKEDSAVLADHEILLGDVGEGYPMNINEDVTMYTEDHIKPRETDYMAYAIIDGAVLDTKAFAYIKKASA